MTRRQPTIFLMRVAALAVALLLVPGDLALAQAGAGKPGSTFNDCQGCPKMVVLPAGSFTMGTPTKELDVTGLSAESREVIEAEAPRHKVRFAKAFAMSQFEVTRAEFAQFIRESGYMPGNGCFVWAGKGLPIVPPSSAPPLKPTPGKSWRDPNFPQTDSHPVVCVTWGDANAYVEWLAKKTGKPYALPSEAQWEYGARAGSASRFGFGARIEDLCKYGNVFDLTAKDSGGPPNGTYTNCRDGFAMVTAPAGSYPPNRFGLYDMHGNVSEWVADCYHENYDGAPADGSVWLAGTPITPAELAKVTDPLKKAAKANPCQYHAIRAAGFSSPPVLNRPGFRHWLGMGIHTDSMGFRVARML